MERRIFKFVGTTDQQKHHLNSDLNIGQIYHESLEHRLEDDGFICLIGDKGGLTYVLPEVLQDVTIDIKLNDFFDNFDKISAVLISIFGYIALYQLYYTKNTLIAFYVILAVVTKIILIQLINSKL